MHKKISYGGIGCAVCILLLVMSSYLPTLKLATLFASSVIPYVIFKLAGFRTSIVMYGATSILAFFLCQSGSPSAVAAFVICFGNYPVFKGLIDKKTTAIRVTVKLLLYVVYFVAVYFVFTKFLLIPMIYSPVLIFAAGVVVFFFYDYLLKTTGIYLLYRLNNHNKT